MSDLFVFSVSVGDVRINEANARTHSKKQVQQIANSIQSFGFNNPVLLDSSNVIIAGHGRYAAAKLLGMGEVPALRLAHLSEAQKRAYILADNRLAELAGWDREILAIELQNLLDMDLDFELSDTGFDTADIDLLLMETGSKADPEEAPLPPAQGPAISKPGQLWEIGPHRLLCGSALDADDYAKLLATQKAQMAFTDPPYNVPIDGHVSGLGKVRHAEFAMASGEMSEAEFTRFLSTAFKHMAEASVDGSMHFICMDWRHLLELLRAGRIAYTEHKNLCVWVKDNGGMGSLYRSQHELVGVFKAGTAPHINNVELGRHGRYRTNVWSYAGMNSFQAGRDEKLAMHPTVKPVGLVADAILDCSRRGDIILDPFLGSGTTLVAAHRTGRRCYGIELDPLYVDVSLRRARSALELEPVCQATGATFSDLEHQARSVPAELDLIMS